MNISIHPLKREEVDSLVTIEKEVFSYPWTKKMFEQEIEEGSHFFVVKKSGMIIAYGGFWQIEDEAHLVNLAVAPSHQKKGIGSYLLRWLINRAKEMGIKRMTLEVEAKNSAAISFYHKFGFSEIAIRKGYYEQKDDAIVMWSNLQSGGAI
jgi:ribosomal-protein-alanine N-acetyltransferase